jgi:hypothetical protein
MMMAFFIIIKTFLTIAIKQTPCQIQMEFAPLWHKKGLAPRKGIGWCGFQVHEKRKMVTFGWPTITIHLQGNVSSFSFYFFSSFFFPLCFPIVFFLFCSLLLFI